MGNVDNMVAKLLKADLDILVTRRMATSRVLGKKSDPRAMVKRFNNMNIDPKEGKGRCLVRLSQEG